MLYISKYIIYKFFIKGKYFNSNNKNSYFGIQLEQEGLKYIEAKF